MRLIVTPLVALVVVALVAVIAVLVRLTETRFAFFPLAGETTTPGDFGVAHRTVTIETSDGERLRAWVMDHPTPRGQIVYFHGNGGNLSMWAPILAGIARRGYSVLAFDYRGYGESSGHPTEQGLYRDVDAALGRFRVDLQRGTTVVYWGRSLGATLAAYAATVQPPDGLILESAFPDVRTLVRGSPMSVLALFSSLRFPAAEFVRQIGVPTLIMHGDRDSIIPYDQGKALFARVGGPKQFFTIRGGDHNDASPPDPRAYWEAIDAFVAALERREPFGGD